MGSGPKRDFAFKAPSRRFEQRLGKARWGKCLLSLTGRTRVLGASWAYLGDLCGAEIGNKKARLGEGRAGWDAKEEKIAVYAGAVSCLFFSRSDSIAWRSIALILS